MKKKTLDLRAEILKEHSKKQTTFLAEYIGNDPEKFAELIRLFTGDEYRVTQRAGWIVSYCAEAHPELIAPHLPALVQQLTRTVHDAVKRNVVRVLQFQHIPENLQGEVVEVCFHLLLSAKEPVAVKAFAMTVVYNISREEPGLRNELKMVIEDLLPHGTAAIVSRGTKILRKLEQTK